MSARECPACGGNNGHWYWCATVGGDGPPPNTIMEVGGAFTQEDAVRLAAWLATPPAPRWRRWTSGALWWIGEALIGLGERVMGGGA